MIGFCAPAYYISWSICHCTLDTPYDLVDPQRGNALLEEHAVTYLPVCAMIKNMTSFHVLHTIKINTFIKRSSISVSVCHMHARAASFGRIARSATWLCLQAQPATSKSRSSF